MMTIPPLVLASASPARLRLLQQAGIFPQVHPSHFDESQVQSSDPETLVKTLAQRKAETIAPEYEKGDRLPLILGCDSVLAINDRIYGKPGSAAEAMTRWQEMRGQKGALYTGYALLDLEQKRSVINAEVTYVYFARVSDRALRAYIATKEPLNCAGAFAIEGKGGLFVERIEGCHMNVIGLSLPCLRSMVEQLGYDLTQWWESSTH
nr:Maf family protein [Roseofilum halophilum]